MNETERQILIDHLERTRDAISRVTAGLSAAQWDFRETPDRWTITEVIEHLAVVEGRILARVEKKLSDPPEPEKRPLTAGKDATVPAMMPMRTSRVTAPEPVRPTGRWDRGEVLAQFHAARERTLVFARQNRHDLRDHIFPHAAMGEMDGYQWLLFISGHAERHALQIDEIKSHAGYPATGWFRITSS